MGIGYNTTTMGTADFTMCQLLYSNQTTDNFTCLDGMFLISRQPPFTFDEHQDIANVTTLLVTYDYSNNSARANFSVQFTRPFGTEEGDTGEDKNLTFNESTSIIWAYGNMTNATTPNPHLPGNNGTAFLDLTVPFTPPSTETTNPPPNEQ